MASDRKLSKKEQKAAAFKSNEKQRGKDKGKGKSRNDASGEAADLPENDLLDDHGRLAQPEEQDDEAKSVLSSIKTKKGKRKSETEKPDEVDGDGKSASKKSKGKGKDKAADSVAASTDKTTEKETANSKSAGKKRKRPAQEDESPKEASAAAKAKKTTFSEEGQAEATVTVATDDSQAEDAAAANDKESAAKESTTPKRYIAFVGNMSFKTTPDEIAAHFASHCGEKPSVRLLTKKVDPEALSQLSKSKQKSIAKGKASHPAAGGTSRGCGFIEFKDAAALQKALHFHHTFLGARQINVELTAGGGGKTKERLAKIKTKNEKLDKERVSGVLHSLPALRLLTIACFVIYRKSYTRNTWSQHL